LLALCVLVILGAAVGVGIVVHGSNEPAAVRTQNLFIPVLDGPAHNQRVEIDATVYYPATTPAPAMLVSPGFGDTKDSLVTDATEFAQRGFVVLAYTPRGFGRSTGQIALNSPDYEVADAKQLIDWLGHSPSVLTDGPDDPRVGVTGGSYGGALSLMLAGSDKRVDAIAPVITYNDLSQALIPNAASPTPVDADTPAAGAFAPNGVFKKSWASLFFAEGLTGGSGTTPTTDAPDAGSGTSDTGSDSSSSTTGPSAADPPSPGTSANVCGRFIQQVCQAYQELASTGQASQQTIDLLRADSPVSVTDHITVPTLLVQGEQDTLFGLDQADANARQITRAGGKVKVIWYDGGHDAGQPGPDLRQEIGQFFSYELMHKGTDPGTDFEYAVQGSLSSNGEPTVRTVTAASYPGLTAGSTGRQALTLTGPPSTVLNPPGGSPAAMSSLPGIGSALGAAASRLFTDVPGEFAGFSTAPLSSQLLIAGSPRVTLQVSAAPGQPSGNGAVLFAKLYDLSPNGTRTLPGSAVAPIRIGALPADGSPVTVNVTLPGIVQPVQSGHRLELVVSTTDQSFANAQQPAALRIALANGSTGNLAVPVVPGRTSTTPLPVGQLIAIGVVLVLVILAAAFLWLRRRRTPDLDRNLADVPLAMTNLSKSYPGGLLAVDSLSFRVEQGQVVGLLGPNGAGKTTALRMMMGLVRPSSGQIRVFGQLVRPGAPVLSRIGSFVEGSGFLPHLSGTANLHLYWQATGRPEQEARFEEALAIAGLGDAVARKVGTYSQGMRQRLAIAQAMLGLPDLLVLDEPTNGLDPPQIRDMREVLRGYAAGGRTVLVSSHLLTEVEQTCTHVVVMHHGKLVAAGEVGEIVTGNGETAFTVDDPAGARQVLGELDGVALIDDPKSDDSKSDAPEPAAPDSDRPDSDGADSDGSEPEESEAAESVAIDDRAGAVYAHLNGVPRSEAVSALVRAGVAVDQVGPRGRLEDVFLQLVGGERS
jgi:ABC-2 type transport system ATP-binding protein